MAFALWVTIGGVLLIFMALVGSVFSRLPLSTAMLYLAVGAGLSPAWLGLSAIEPIAAAGMLERLTEAVVLISLFTSGLKLSAGLHDRRWLPPLRLALVSMLVTVVAVALIGTALLGLSLGAAVLLGGILAPTDPVLASDVQVANPSDRDQLRFALTGEGGLNDGTAFPVVMLGLGLLGLHEIGPFGWRWLAVDVAWATAAGLGLGAALGASVGKLVLFLRQRHKEAVGYDNFLALGLIGLAYGIALLVNAYGFLAVFAAGVALRRIERQATAAAVAVGVGVGVVAPVLAAAQARTDVEEAHASADPSRGEALAVDPVHASAFMAHAVLSFNEQLDRIGELCAVIVLGMLLWAVQWQHASWWFVAVLMLIVRPASVAVGLAGSSVLPGQRRLMGWFGIRGIGSLFYLAYAINHGVAPELAQILTAITLSVVVTSIVVHGISVTPLMAMYAARRGR